MSRDVGIVEVVRRRIVEDGLGLEVRTHEDGVFGGTIGTALWAGWRHHDEVDVAPFAGCAAGPGAEEDGTGDRDSQPLDRIQVEPDLG